MSVGSFYNYFNSKNDILIEIYKRADDYFENEISSNMSPEEICDYLFIAARGIVYDWCLHDDTYYIKEAMHNYLSLLINIFKLS